jgi:hypothetical protein
VDSCRPRRGRISGVNPTGTVTFRLYDNPSGTGTPLFTATAPLVGGTATSAGYTTTATGTDYWVATYTGDANNTAVSSSVASEPVTVSPASPMLTTTAGGTVVLGSGATLTDTATLSGGFSPTGSLTFTLHDSSNAVVDSETAAVHGNGTYSTPTGSVPSTAGTYQWEASYSGDGNNTPVSSTLGSEPQTVTPASPTLLTTPAPSTVTLGPAAPPLQDAATLSGGFTPTGSITFTLLGPDGVTPVDSETVGVTSNGTYSTATGFTLPPSGPVTGTYQWEASYSGDGNNSAVRSGPGSEPVTVSPATPTLTTSPGPSVPLGSGSPLTDTATVSGGFRPSGSITFTLHDPSNTVVDTETVMVTGNGSYSTPSGAVPTAAGTYQWGASSAVMPTTRP